MRLCAGATPGSTPSAWPSKAMDRSASRVNVDLGGSRWKRGPVSRVVSDGERPGRAADYFVSAPRSDFIDNLCRKLLAYALGRSLISVR